MKKKWVNKMTKVEAKKQNIWYLLWRGKTIFYVFFYFFIPFPPFTTSISALSTVSSCWHIFYCCYCLFYYICCSSFLLLWIEQRSTSVTRHTYYMMHTQNIPISIWLILYAIFHGLKTVRWSYFCTATSFIRAQK